MTQDVNNEYLKYLARPEKTPVYIVEFDGITTRYSDHQVQGQLGPTSVIAKSVSGAGAQITVDEGRSSIGDMTFSLLDKDQEVTKLLQQYVLNNKRVTIFAGFIDMQEADYVKMFVGEILDFTLERDNVTWKFQVVTLWKTVKQNVMTAASNLTSGINDAVTTIPVVGTADFASATAGEFYIIINDEVISYTGKTGTTFTGCTRGELGTTPAAHSNSDRVKNFVVLQDNPVNIMLRILTSTGLGTNGAYDDLPASAGLGIDEDDVAVTSMEAERDRWLLGFTMKFELFDLTEAKRFLESEVLRFINAYPLVDNEGRLSMTVYTPPLPTVQIRQLNDDNLVEAPTWQGNLLARFFFNEIDMQYDYDFLTNTFGTRAFFEDSTSQVTYGDVKTLTMQSKGIRTAIMGQPKIDKIALRALQRFANPSPIIRAKAFMTERIVEPGDIVRLTTTKLPDLSRGSMGVVDQMVEALQVGTDYQRGVNNFMLLDTGFSYGRKYGAISPPTTAPINFPTYDVATPDQRLYCFVSTKVNPTKGLMNDGSDGYYITS